MINLKAISVACLSTLSFAAAVYLIGFGVVVSCGADAGVSRVEKLFYGVLPICAGVFAIALAFRYCSRGYVRRCNAWIAGCFAFLLAAALDTAAFLKYREYRIWRDDGVRLAWKADASVFSWGRGEVRLPAGFKYERDQGIDTYVGQFTSQDGKVTVRYDIGELAGENGGMGRLASETLVKGSRVKAHRGTVTDERGRTKFFSGVSFPDSGCANFYVESTVRPETDVVDLIATSFRPTNGIPSWLHPLLPEVLRSDCRYRVRLPTVF